MEALHTLTAEATTELQNRAEKLSEPPDKLSKAVALVEEGRIEQVLGEEDKWEVVGSKGTIYTTTPKACSCAATSRSSPQTRYPCYHMLGIALYRWVIEAMQKQGLGIYVDEPLRGIPPKTLQDAQEGGEHIDMSHQSSPTEKVDPAPQEGAKTGTIDNAQRQEIRRLLTLYGLKPTNREEYAAAIETHVGVELVPDNFPMIIERLGALIAARRNALPSPKLLADYMVDIKGKKHVQYSGLLAYAHEQGLISLTASLTTATKDLAIATATATFKDGRTFTETADATPENVGAQIKPHFMRMAVTRAKARALRDALNIAEAAAEELE